MAFIDIVKEHPEVARHVQAVHWAVAASFILLNYDWLLTFADEVELIWKARLGLPKILFLVLRYVPLCAFMFNTFVASGRHSIMLSDQFCQGFFVAMFLVGFVSLAISQFLVLLRLWVMWDRNPRLMLWTLFGYIVSQGATFVAIALNFKPLHAVSYFDVDIHSCFWSQKIRLWPQWVPSLAFEVLVFLLTWYNALSRPRGGDNEMTKQMYRDGCLYFFTLLACRTGNAIIAAIASPALMYITFLIWAFANLTTNRLILNYRRLTVNHQSAQTRAAVDGDVVSEVDSDQAQMVLDRYTLPPSPSRRSKRTNSDVEQWSPVVEEVRMENRFNTRKSLDMISGE